MDRKAAYQAGVAPLYFGGVMTEPDKKDYRKDGQYGISPVLLALSDVEKLNITRKTLQNYKQTTTSSTDKKDYCRDTLCTANKYQEKDCLHFKPYESFTCRYPNICRFQGVGTTCNAKGKE